MQALASKFIPVADEVGRLQRGQDAECRFFQRVAEQGHYAGREKPSNTRQGIYAVTASGEFLASINTRDGKQVAGMLERALARFAALSRTQRAGEVPALEAGAATRFEALYPVDGLALHVFTRDLPRDKTARGWRGQAWNQDYAWLRKSEVLSCLPEPRVGAERAMPDALVQRLVRCHLIDSARGQTPPHRAEDIKSAQLTWQTTAIEAETLVLRLHGAVRVERHGSWPVDSFRTPLEEQQLGYDAQLLGTARFDQVSQRCTSFRLLAVGLRWGGTEFNGRHDDLGAAPMGVAFTLADPAQRTAPASYWVYGWK